MIRKLLAGLIVCCFLATTALAQEETPKNWFNSDANGPYPGMSVDAAHDYLAGKTGQEVIVAIIDSGVDIEHEDLQSIIWTNEDEIPGNGIDDDNNGYVDDVHGWNFIGGADGDNINYENLEIVRLYNKYQQRFGTLDPAGMSKAERAEYAVYQEYKTEIEEKREELAPQAMMFSTLYEAFQNLVEESGKEPADITEADLDEAAKGNETLAQPVAIIKGMMAQGMTFEEIYEDQIKAAYEYFYGQYAYNWNPDYDARDIVGDDPSNLDDRRYGNNDVEGPDANHGTHVAGIVAAIRDNDIGMNGVAANVRIMSVRTVPNGDERDKDVANAIRYAVDNGAQVINMSFGKGYSPYKQEVDEAVRYARKNDVLLIHAAGNDGKELLGGDEANNFPNDEFAKRGFLGPKFAKNWISVGAITPAKDADLVAGFSNWSPSYVDVFAPGEQIYSTVPDDKYASLQGTSMAAPMVAGVAALLRSYFPDLKAEQVKEILLASATPMTMTVVRPGGEDTEVAFTSLSVTGGVVDALAAVRLAEVTKGKKKRTPERDPALQR